MMWTCEEQGGVFTVPYNFHFVLEGLDLCRSWVLDIEFLDGHGSVPRALVDCSKGARSNPGPWLDLLHEDLPILIWIPPWTLLWKAGRLLKTWGRGRSGMEKWQTHQLLAVWLGRAGTWTQFGCVGWWRMGTVRVGLGVASSMLMGLCGTAARTAAVATHSYRRNQGS